MIAHLSKMTPSIAFLSQLPSRENVEKTLQLKWAQIVSLAARENTNPSMSGKG